MRFVKTFLLVLFLLPLIIISQDCADSSLEVERPETIKSKRIVWYDQETYAELADRWEAYFRQFPSEDAYANWMYAARYAEWDNYRELLEKGLRKYPANPVLLYLAGNLKYGTSENEEGRIYLERAVALDPSYLDPWFNLVTHYMELDDQEQLNVALRRLLEGGAISDEVMDYSYNMLLPLDENAILITNGDNDTYPGWILKRLLNHRPDVIIINRSLLNTDWYPVHVIKEGAPRFITTDELDELRKSTKPPYSEFLIPRLIKAATREGRPVYFSHTLYQTEMVKHYMEEGEMIGLATLVTPLTEPYEFALKRTIRMWLEDFRTAGMDSWTLKYSKSADAGRMLMRNYPASLNSMLEFIERYVPEYRLSLFSWYQEHCVDLLSDELADKMNCVWCAMEDVSEIQEWCNQQGYNCNEL